ncbi:hypothetical protein HZ992_14990 [Rhizobacter sp. AJA081-3]|uniref:hypothetical protein n=1 Tax=Rhizobacter sp. AJA081-3 TaxID=2753607 RepID=UPI001AE0255A|nr:hypothetical protein [Rhizobacter sp. AJA081-3]QTN21490.1 hypothetical protein HZ992_14990 [Rhizobacter sp. AJA081-3]
MSPPANPEPPKSPELPLQPSIETNTPPIRRPPEIGLAFWAIISSAALGAFSFVARGQREPLFIVFCVLAVLVAFAFLIRSGKNWARITYLVFFLIGLSSFLVVRELIALNGKFFFVIFCVQTVLQSYAAWLVFRPPANRWFRRGRAN